VLTEQVPAVVWALQFTKNFDAFFSHAIRGNQYFDFIEFAIFSAAFRRFS